MKRVKTVRKNVLTAILWCAVVVALVFSMLQYFGVSFDVSAGYSKTFPFQGRLTNDDGTNVTDGGYDMKFRIYDCEACKPGELWWEEHTGKQAVAVEDSVFNVVLGTIRAIDLDFNSGTYWLEIEVNGETLSPRRRIGGTGYAINSDHLDGLTPAAFTLDFVASKGATTSRALTLNGTVTTGGILNANGTTNINGTLNANGEANIGNGGSAVTINGSTVTFNDSNLTSGGGAIPLTLSATGLTGGLTNGIIDAINQIAAGGAGLWLDNVGGDYLYPNTTYSDNINIASGTLTVGSDGTGYDINFYGDTAGSRFFWDESKMALRVGIDTDGTHWNDANVGFYSVAFGYDNTASSGFDIVSGGYNNTASGGYAIVAGGNSNTVSVQYGTISGGYNNTIVSQNYGTISGGTNNTVSGSYGTIAGGTGNASGGYATVSGGGDNTAAGVYSWVGGHYMDVDAAADNTFLWGNHSSEITVSQADSFIIGPGGGSVTYSVGINDPTPSYALDVTGSAQITNILGVGTTPTATYGIDVLEATADGRGINITKTGAGASSHGMFITQSGSPTNSYGIYFESSTTAGTNNYGAFFRLVSNTGDHFGIVGEVIGSEASSNNYGGNFYATGNTVDGANYGSYSYATGTATNNYGVYGYARDATTAYGGYFLADDPEGDPTTNYGVYSAATAGTATTNYALYGTASGATTNYGLYIAAGYAYFASGSNIGMNVAPSATRSLNIFNDTGGAIQYGIYSRVQGATQNRAAAFELRGGTETDYVIFAHMITGDTGTNSILQLEQTQGGADTDYGVYSALWAPGSGSNYAGYFLNNGNGADSDYGIYAEVTGSGGGTDYAGFFNPGSNVDYGVYIDFGADNNALYAQADIANGYVARFFNDGDAVNRHGLTVQAGDDAATGTTYYLTAEDGNGDDVGYLQWDGANFQAVNFSDSRLKTNIAGTSLPGLDIIEKLRVVDFNWRQNPNGRQVHGFIAQEVEKVFPYMVSRGQNGMLTIGMESLIPVITKAIQQQQDQIEELQVSGDTESISRNINSLEDRIGSLESQFSSQANSIRSLTDRITALESQEPMVIPPNDDGIPNSINGDFAVSGDIDIQGTIKASSIWSQNATWHIDSQGELFVQSIQTQDIEIAEGEDKAIGNELLPTGETEISVANTSITAQSRIFLTIEQLDDLPAGVKVKSKQPNQGFVISTIDGQPATNDVSINWLIIN